MRCLRFARIPNRRSVARLARHASRTVRSIFPPAKPARRISYEIALALFQPME